MASRASNARRKWTLARLRLVLQLRAWRWRAGGSASWNVWWRSGVSVRAALVVRCWCKVKRWRLRSVSTPQMMWGGSSSYTAAQKEVSLLSSGGCGRAMVANHAGTED